MYVYENEENRGMVQAAHVEGGGAGGWGPRTGPWGCLPHFPAQFLPWAPRLQERSVQTSVYPPTPDSPGHQYLLLDSERVNTGVSSVGFCFVGIARQKKN